MGAGNRNWVKPGVGFAKIQTRKGVILWGGRNKGPMLYQLGRYDFEDIMVSQQVAPALAGPAHFKRRGYV